METAAQARVVKALRCTFKDQQEVGGASFRVERDEIFGLLGLNWAGKTPTIRWLARWTRMGGGASIAGCDVVKDRARL